jgi:hypothetical protein
MSRNRGPPCCGHVLGGGDVDDGRHELVDQVGEALRRVARVNAEAPAPDQGSNGRDCGTLQKALKISRSRPTSNGAQAKRVGTAGRAFGVTVYMYGDCGANKEAVTLLINSAFRF